MITSLVLVGPHGSGKTTLGQRIAARLGWAFDAEIGAQLRGQALSRDDSAHARQPQAAFDRSVFRREFARDAARGGRPRVIETWHPGNLAYASRRSPEVASEFWPVVAEAIAGQRGRVLVQPLEIGWATFQARFREPGPPDEAFRKWMLEVGCDAVAQARALGFAVLEPLKTDQCSVDQAVEQVYARFLSLSKRGVTTAGDVGVASRTALGTRAA